jgi:hypothetical protein
MLKEKLQRRPLPPSTPVETAPRGRCLGVPPKGASTGWLTAHLAGGGELEAKACPAPPGRHARPSAKTSPGLPPEAPIRSVDSLGNFWAPQSACKGLKFFPRTHGRQTYVLRQNPFKPVTEISALLFLSGSRSSIIRQNICAAWFGRDPRW